MPAPPEWAGCSRRGIGRLCFQESADCFLRPHNEATGLVFLHIEPSTGQTACTGPNSISPRGQDLPFGSLLFGLPEHWRDGEVQPRSLSLLLDGGHLGLRENHMASRSPSSVGQHRVLRRSKFDEGRSGHDEGVQGLVLHLASSSASLASATSPSAASRRTRRWSLEIVGSVDLALSSLFEWSIAARRALKSTTAWLRGLTRHLANAGRRRSLPGSALLPRYRARDRRDGRRPGPGPCTQGPLRSFRRDSATRNPCTKNRRATRRPPCSGPRGCCPMAQR